MKTRPVKTLAAALLLAALPALAAKPAPAPEAAKPPAKTPVDTVLLAGAVVTVDPQFRVLGESAIVIKDGTIFAIVAPADVDARFTPARRIDRRSSVVMPGLVNTHTHAAMTLMRGIADDMPLREWLEKRIFPAEAKNVSPAFVKAGTELACLEMARGGTTTFADMYYFESDVAAAVDRAGLRAVLGETWLDFPVPDHKDLPEEIATTRAFLEKWKGHRRIRAAVAPHAPYTNGKEGLLAAKALADEFHAPLLIHVSETKDEEETIQKKYGTTPTQWLDSIGFLGPNVLFAHGVWLTPKDLEIMAAKKVALSHNPESNMKLASGVAPVVAARAAGVVVGLGTDGPAGSNNDLDMWEAMDFAGKLAKVTAMDPTVLPARDLIRMATIDGARALGLGDLTGSLESGKAADLIAVDLNQPRTRPVYDVASTIVYAAKESDVSLTMVDGKVVWDGHAKENNWPTLDAAAVMKAASEWREKISKSLGAPPAENGNGAKPEPKK